MRTVTVQRTLRAPIEGVFDILADHEGYSQMPEVRSAKLVRPGSGERNGVGAIREIDFGSAWFREEITTFERPTRLDYRVLKSRPPIEEASSIRLRSVEAGTDVTWTARVRVTYPIVGALLTVYIARQLAQGFESFLAATEGRATPRESPLPATRQP
jgi:uncharacterized protein YndB with AHSA1/START domain